LHALEIISLRFSPKNSNSLEENSIACDYLVQCFSCPNVIVAANALDALFELYSEENFD
jgi:hypothetical protein